MKFSSKLLEEAVEAFSGLPGIGKKTAMRLVLFLVKRDPDFTEKFTTAIAAMRKGIRECATCGNLSDHEICGICSDPARDQQVICVVENVRDVMAIEETGHFRGVYHVLGGVISPIDGVGPEELNIASLAERVEQNDVKEVIMAISPTIEGDTTIYYLSRQLADHGVNISTLARGISFGGELEYADELTLARSLDARIPYKSS